MNKLYKRMNELLPISFGNSHSKTLMQFLVVATFFINIIKRLQTSVSVINILQLDLN